eukprot:GHVL01002583.1.p1 GENE.GHVL01002583.1~~GHVL01002583.1.p1  ORF type:complete len:383 (+),score=47.73 GHVL01002583.1:40-1188(+)
MSANMDRQEHLQFSRLRRIDEDTISRLQLGDDIQQHCTVSGWPKCVEYPLSCEPGQLSQLGSGYALYFDTFKSYLYLTFLQILAYAAVIHYYFDARSNDRHLFWGDVNDNQGYALSRVGNLATFANYGRHGDTSLLVPIISIAYIIFNLIFIIYQSRRIRVFDKKINKGVIHPNEYAVMVTGLPSDATNEAEIKSFFENDDVNVVKVVIGYDYSTMPKEPDESTVLENSGFSIVVFEEKEDQQSCLKDWNTSVFKKPSTPKFRDTYTLKVQNAPNPSDILWENLGRNYSGSWAKMCSWIAILFVFGVSSGVLYGLALATGLVLENNDGVETTLFLIIPSFYTIYSNNFIESLTEWFVEKERHYTRTNKDLSIFYKKIFGIVF